ncbi:class I adenylate-forming enzyme family protein [Aeropyrum pernix]|uniref:class I adenylate-forming enzyme family protein n=1 Tax=Aeropyrum pernix TaxID=56636 RepID=UPI00130538D9|nr:class I adenylate-forming enzyme family protein [Aeropyrum pernix]
MTHAVATRVWCEASPAKPWEELWPPQAPRDVEALRERFTPIHEEIFKRSSREGCALIQGETGYCYTWKSLASFIERIGGWLQSKGVSHGAQVAVASENLIEAIAFSLAVLASGARLVLIDPLTVGEDLEWQLEGRRGLETLAASRGFLERNREAVSRIDNISTVIELSSNPQPLEVGGVEVLGLNEVLSSTAALEDDVEPDDDSFSIYYAGIAGRTMQAIHSHLGLWMGSKVFAATAGIDRETVSLLATPFTHVLGLQASLVAPLIQGGTVVALQRWNPRLAARLVSSLRINYLAGVPLMFQQLLDLGATSGLRLAISAGAPLPPELQRRFGRETGIPLLQAYGMSESLILTFQTPKIAEIEGTIGVPLPGVEVSLLGDDGLLSPPPGVGELVVQAPWVMKGYEFEEENSKAFIDGWLRTGDVIEITDRGVMFFRGVRKRIIKYKGYAILARDLEVILESHPDVLEARVWGEPAGDVGQIPVASVVLRAGSSVTPEDLMEYVNQRVSFYKKIRRVEVEGYRYSPAP